MFAYTANGQKAGDRCEERGLVTVRMLQVILLSLNGMNRNQPLIDWANENADRCWQSAVNRRLIHT
jgi:hypothetical protein